MFNKGASPRKGISTLDLEKVAMQSNNDINEGSKLDLRRMSDHSARKSMRSIDMRDNRQFDHLALNRRS